MHHRWFCYVVWAYNSAGFTYHLKLHWFSPFEGWSNIEWQVQVELPLYITLCYPTNSAFLFFFFFFNFLFFLRLRKIIYHTERGLVQLMDGLFSITLHASSFQTFYRRDDFIISFYLSNFLKFS